LDEYAKDETNLFVRDSCIQRFEYCYSLSVKFMERHLKAVSADPDEIKQMAFPNQVREAYSIGVLKNSWDQWSQYRDARSITPCAINAPEAKKVIRILPFFLAEIQFLLECLQQTNEHTKLDRDGYSFAQLRGALKNSKAFSGDPVTIQRTMHSKWD
jgi:nucleotidyltransferase substrate binding protein (TIGR01987 family)